MLIALAGLPLLFSQIADAQQYFTNYPYGELIAGFRKTGGAVENNEMIVYLGNITNFIALSVGTTIPITNYSNAQITHMCPDNLANLQWSVFAAFAQIGIGNPWVTPVGTFQNATLWQTQPRTVFGTPSTPPARLTTGFSTKIRADITGMISGAATDIGPSLGPTNQYNDFLVCTEPTSDDSTEKTYSYIIDPTATGIGNFNFNDAINIENVTPSPFSSPQRSDLFEFTPSGLSDPFNGTSSSTYYLGYFTLNTDGTMTFTRDAASVANPQPLPPVLTISTSIISSGGSNQENSVISFNTTNAATYTLYYTNASGLTSAVSNWATMSTTVTGDGLTHSVTNTSSDPNRFYRIGAQ